MVSEVWLSVAGSGYWTDPGLLQEVRVQGEQRLADPVDGGVGGHGDLVPDIAGLGGRPELIGDVVADKREQRIAVGVPVRLLGNLAEPRGVPVAAGSIEGFGGRAVGRERIGNLGHSARTGSGRRLCPVPEARSADEPAAPVPVAGLHRELLLDVLGVGAVQVVVVQRPVEWLPSGRWGCPRRPGSRHPRAGMHHWSAGSSGT